MYQGRPRGPTGRRGTILAIRVPAKPGPAATTRRPLASAASSATVCAHARRLPQIPSTIRFHKAYAKQSVDTSQPITHGDGDRATFEVAHAKGYEGTFDLICFFDCLHDMGDPVGIARYAREHLEPDGTVLLVEPFALDDRLENLSQNPMAPLLYTASSAICTPNSLSREVALGLGAQASEARLRRVFEEAGFTRFRRAADTPLNLILEARP